MHKETTCKSAKPHGRHQWTSGKTQWHCNGLLRDEFSVKALSVKERKAERLPDEKTCARGLDLLHEEWHQGGWSKWSKWSGYYNSFHPAYTNSYTMTWHISHEPIAYKTGYTYYPAESSTPVTEPVTQSRETELRGLLSDCWLSPRTCGWQHDDSNEDD